MTSLHTQIFENMNMVVLRHEQDDQFEIITPPGEWFAEIWPAAYKRGPFVIRGVSPFLDNFLTDAALQWTSDDGKTAKSGPFIEVGATTSNAYPLEATAFVTGSERILIVTNLGESFEETQAMLQAARENLLTQEMLEVEVSKRTQEIRDREAEVATRLIYAAGFRDEETGAHIRRIGLYSAAMAQALGWNQTMIDDIRTAAPMHDIGKIGIEDAILQKPGKLEGKELSRMREHAQIGRMMLEDSEVSMLKMAADIAGAHHENWDGSGYPRGLKGEDIPLSARIVAIVDVYDALVHERVYKEAFSEEQAIEMMQEQSAKKFDPRLLSLFFTQLDTMRQIRQEVLD